MEDIFETTMLCTACSKPTIKKVEEKEGFMVRTWFCEHCKKEWYHPTDLEEYKRFKELKHKTYHVKLRLVGNSYTVSIPREIIDFQEEMRKEMDRMLNLTLDEPERLSLYFSKRIRRLMK